MRAREGNPQIVSLFLVPERHPVEETKDQPMAGPCVTSQPEEDGACVIGTREGGCGRQEGQESTALCSLVCSGGFGQAALPHSPVLKHGDSFPSPRIVLFQRTE